MGSRRQIEGWIAAGRVSVNGTVASLGARAGPGDEIAVDGKPVKAAAAQKPRVLLYHKPVGELVTRSDPEGRPTVFSRLPPGRWIAVGRLDFNTSGLLLVTDSGELANRLMHPRYELEREYAVRVLGEPSAEQLRDLEVGVELDDGVARLASIEHAGGAANNRWYHILLREGRHRELRAALGAVGVAVSRVIRVRFGPIKLGKLRRGGSRPLSVEEVAGLYALAGLAPPKPSRATRDTASRAQARTRAPRGTHAPRGTRARGRG